MDTAILAFASPDRFLPKRKTQAAVAALETIPCNLCINPLMVLIVQFPIIPTGLHVAPRTRRVVERKEI